MTTVNINLGLLGHVDSGKTTLAKSLSEISSTACFDKNPQSQARGITIDLGFSSFTVDATEYLKNSGYDKIQYTLVDCPGHASLIRTVIGGAQIIDFVILVIDITKGVQTQTAECIIISEIISKPMLIVLNKVDLLPKEKRENTINKVIKKMQITLQNTPFKSAPIVPISANGSGPEGLDKLIIALKSLTTIIQREINKPLLMAVDHCFTIKGKGTIMTGTLLQGTLKTNDTVEIPALNMTKKIKSMQMFKKDVSSAVCGDRVGLCVTQFDPKMLERGLICDPGYLSPMNGAIIKLNKVEYFRNPIVTGSKYHISIGYETVMAKLTLFVDVSASHKADFSFEKEYAFLQEYREVIDLSTLSIYGLLEMEHPIISHDDAFLIGSKLDVDVNTAKCRIAFYGNIIYSIKDKNYEINLLPQLKIFKSKEKIGIVQKIVNKNEVIAHSIFKKETKMHKFINLKVLLSTGESGVIESTFGQGGKVRISIPEGLKESTLELLTKNSSHNLNFQTNSDRIKVILTFKKYIYDKNKKIIQN